MRKSIISLVMLGGLLTTAQADELKLQDNVPDRYVVVKGDTLWDISGKFLKQPWRWPEIWQLNRDEIKNPHWIYPGDVIVLDTSGGTPRLRLVKNGESAGANGVTVLSPRVRSEELSRFAIPSIAPSVIEPFLSQPLVVSDAQLRNAPRIGETQDGRVIVASGENAYVVGMPTTEVTGTWQVFRPGKALLDPDSKNGKEVLGHEAVYLGDARVLKRDGKVNTIRLVSSKQEVVVGDRLIATNKQEIFNYVPHVPDNDPNGKVISTYGGVSIAGQYSTIVINKGARDGLEPGHVVGLFRHGRLIRKESPSEETLYTPAERNAVAFIFRVFDRVSYALITNTETPVELLDEVHKP
ncbi:LysM peptidoglycan-binding domain-containing protein [Chitinivorax sp. PXF-14]|uniref:LysM peptidoglycan-binding domain-containing protein n=1 Tax=Chitinivorax sp. PXF-14 TaxID=3230488 RepID=UPI0034653169